MDKQEEITLEIGKLLINFGLTPGEAMMCLEVSAATMIKLFVGFYPEDERPAIKEAAITKFCKNVRMFAHV